MTCENCIRQNEIDPNIHIISGGPFDSQQECLNSEPKSKAYFIVEDIGSRNFVIELDNIDLIDSARKQIIGLEPKKHIIGNIVKSTIWYNPDYSYYMDPTSISFFELATEVCDATFDYTEEHLEEAGGAFLPGLRLCPWSSYLFSEIDINDINTTTTVAPTTTTTTAPTTTREPDIVSVLNQQSNFYRLSYTAPNQDYLVIETKGHTEQFNKYLNGTVKLGSQPYNNSQLSFYLDSDSVSFSDTPSGSILTSLPNTPQENQLVSFDLASAILQKLRIENRLYCYDSLTWTPTLEQNSSGFYISGSCAGSCENGFVKFTDETGLFESCIPNSNTTTTPQPVVLDELPPEIIPIPITFTSLPDDDPDPTTNEQMLEAEAILLIQAQQEAEEISNACDSVCYLKRSILSLKDSFTTEETEFWKNYFQVSDLGDL